MNHPPPYHRYYIIRRQEVFRLEARLRAAKVTLQDLTDKMAFMAAKISQSTSQPLPQQYAYNEEITEYRAGLGVVLTIYSRQMRDARLNPQHLQQRRRRRRGRPGAGGYGQRHPKRSHRHWHKRRGRRRHARRRRRRRRRRRGVVYSAPPSGAFFLTINSGAAISGGAGGNGQDSGGGGGGAGLFLYADGSTLSMTGGAISGGAGGTGGTGSYANGGGGGDGLRANNSVLDISGTVSGGAGGAASGAYTGGAGGSGIYTYSDSAGGNKTTITVNSGAVVSGGAGGAASGAGTHGAGGVGVRLTGNGATLINAGSINGDRDGGNTLQANAVSIDGNNNIVELRNGYSFSGNVEVLGGSGNILRLGGNAAASFDASQVGATGQYLGFTALEKTGDSTWTLANSAATTALPWTIKGGLINFSTANSFGSGNDIILNGGGLQWGATDVDITSGRSVTLGAGGGVFDTNSYNATLTGSISGTGGLTKQGGGTLTLTDYNNYSGGTTIEGGTLRLGDGFSDGMVTGNITNNANLVFNVTNLSGANYGGSISGTGGLTKQGNATLSLSGNHSYSGPTTISNGQVQLGGLLGNGNYSGAISMAGGASLIFKQNANQILNGNISGTGGLIKQLDSTLTVNGSVNVGRLVIETGVVGAPSTTNRAIFNQGATVGSGGLYVQTGNTLGLRLDNGIIVNGGTATLEDGGKLYLSGGTNGQTYQLIDANGQSIVINDLNQIGLTFDSARKSGVLSLPTADVLQLALQVLNMSLTWTGASNSLWETSSANWSGSPDDKFADGDTVTFTNTGAGKIQVRDTGVSVAAMTVSGGEYALEGGPISGDSLDLTGGRTLLANDVSFAGVDVRGGATLGLAATGSINKGAIAVPSHFTLHSGATLLAEPGAAPLAINAEAVNLQSGGKVGLAGFGYGPLLSQGAHTVLTLGGTTITNNSSLIATSGTIAVGANDYQYENLAWSGNDLTMQVQSPVPNVTRTGVPSITGSSHIAALNPAFNVFGYHSKGLFGNWANLPRTSDYSQGALQYARAANGSASDGTYLAAGENSGSKYLNQLWVTPNYVNVNQSAGGNNVGYNLQTPGFALGYDRQLCENAFVGAGVSVSWPDYSGGGTDINAQDITFALYGGYRLPYAIELDAHAGFGFTRYDQDREVQAERYSNKYNGQNFFAGLGLGRPFALGGGFSLRPGVAYDFIHLNTDGFDEGQGTFALKADDYTQDIHRVKAGVDVSWREEKSGFVASGEVYYLGVYGDREALASAHFVNDPVNGFTMIGNGLDRDNLGLGLNVALPVSEQWEVGAGYNVLLGSDTVSQQGTLNVTFKF